MLPSFRSQPAATAVDHHAHAASETTTLLSPTDSPCSDEEVSCSNNGRSYTNVAAESATEGWTPATAPSLLIKVSCKLKRLIKHHVGTIGTLGSVSIAVNSLTGPAMLNLPATFARSGIIPTLLTLVFVCALSAFCCLHMANTISKVPGNADFAKEVEYSEAFRCFWGQRWFLITQGLFFCCITCLNISSIVDVAQVIDTICGHWMKTHALQITGPSDIAWIQWDYSNCTAEEMHQGLCLPFREEAGEGLMITMGNLLASGIIIPLALMDLRDNAWWQVVGYAVLLLTTLQFIVQFSMTPDGLSFSNTSWFGNNWDDLFGVVVFNFALVIAIPAWLYEREPHVNVERVVHFSSVLSTIMYISVGLLGCLAMPNVADNMLESMMSGAFGTWMQLGSSVFALAIIGLGSPLFSVLARLNLTGSGLCSTGQANVLAVFIPHVVSWLLNDGGAVTKLLSWGGIVFTALIAFILPILLAIHVVRDYTDKGSIDVYSGWFASRRAELRSLYVLLTLTVVAVALAILGNFTDGPADKEMIDSRLK